MLKKEEPSLDLNPRRAPPKRPSAAKPHVDKPLPWLPNNLDGSIQEDEFVSDLPSGSAYLPSADDLNVNDEAEQLGDMFRGTEDQADSRPCPCSLDPHGVTDSSPPSASNPEGEFQSSPQTSSTRVKIRNEDNLGNNDEPPQRYTELQYTSQPISEASPRLPSFGDLQVDFGELQTRFAEQSPEPIPAPTSAEGQDANEIHAPEPNTLLSGA